jgi:hypothetical protein
MASSHYERYIYALNEEAVDAVNASGIFRTVIPERLRLYHSRPAVEALAETAWESPRRAAALEAFVRNESWLWSDNVAGQLEASRLLAFMSAPTPLMVVRYFRYWGIDDVFSSITRRPHVRTRLFTRLSELVDRRNSIAHGDRAVEPTYHDVLSYIGAVRRFATRTDALFGRHVGTMVGVPPW